MIRRIINNRHPGRPCHSSSVSIIYSHIGERIICDIYVIHRVRRDDEALLQGKKFPASEKLFRSACLLLTRSFSVTNERDALSIYKCAYNNNNIIILNIVCNIRTGNQRDDVIRFTDRRADDDGREEVCAPNIIIRADAKNNTRALYISEL